MIKSRNVIWNFFEIMKRCLIYKILSWDQSFNLDHHYMPMRQLVDWIHICFNDNCLKSINELSTEIIRRNYFHLREFGWMDVLTMPNIEKASTLTTNKHQESPWSILYKTFHRFNIQVSKAVPNNVFLVTSVTKCNVICLKEKKTKKKRWELLFLRENSFWFKRISMLWRLMTFRKRCYAME